MIQLIMNKNNIKEKFYCILINNLLKELSNNNLSISPELLTTFIQLLKKSLYSALDKTFSELASDFSIKE